MLGYSNNKPRPAIICPKSHSDKAHTAYIKDGKWNCTSDMKIRGTLAEMDNFPCWCEKPREEQSAVSVLSSESSATAEPPRATLDAAQHSTADTQQSTVSESPSYHSTLDTDDLFEVVCELDDVAHM
ncbi:hypothetical protein GBAR_LOCUS25733, partial [Geodia barretti]